MQSESKTDELPWNSLLKFHREIRLRAEQSFFSLFAADQNSERWSSIAGFEPSGLAGPWYTGAESVLSKPIRDSVDAAEAGNFILGGLCWYVFPAKSADGGAPRLEYRPALVREVAISSDEEGRLTFDPLQGGWDFSPLLYQWFENLQLKESQVAGLDDALPRILEKAGQGTHGTLEGRLLDALATFFPKLAEGIGKSNSLGAKLVKRPANWILLRPSQGGGSFGVNLIRDYNALIERDNSGEEAGGLRVLSGSPPIHNIGAARPALPLIALNKPQQEAAERVFAFPPVTVIIGPPGCGKSQLVSSLLLNGFARGISMLLASTNNQAVEVVRTRLKCFEIPVVRAGKYSNIVAVLKNIPGDLAPLDTKKLATSAVKRDRLRRECESIRRRCDTGIPLRTEESLQAARKAYDNSVRIEAEKKAQYEVLEKSAAEIGCPGNTAFFEKTWLTPLANWLDQIAPVLELIKKDRAEKVRLDQAISQLEGELDAECEALGVEKEKLDALLTIDDPKAIERLSKCNRELNAIFTDPETDLAFELPPNAPDFDGWKDAITADVWSEQAQVLASKIYQALQETRKDVDSVWDVDAAFSRLRAAPMLNGFSDTELHAIDGTALQTWLAAYAAHLATPKTAFSVWPLSRAWKSERSMRKIEVVLHPVLPTSVWRHTKMLDDDGRSRLADVLNAIRDWQAARGDVAAMSPKRRLLDQQFGLFGGALKQFVPLAEIPEALDRVKWGTVQEELQEFSYLAARARNVGS